MTTRKQFLFYAGCGLALIPGMTPKPEWMRAAEKALSPNSPFDSSSKGVTVFERGYVPGTIYLKGPIERDGQDIWWMVWRGKFQGEHYGNYMVLDEYPPQDILDEYIRMFCEMACFTLDSLASTAIGEPHGYLPGELFLFADWEDRDEWERLEDAYSDLNHATWEAGPIPEMQHDSYWLARAQRRKEIMAEFGVTWEQIEALREGRLTYDEVRNA